MDRVKEEVAALYRIAAKHRFPDHVRKPPKFEGQCGYCKRTVRLNNSSGIMHNHNDKHGDMCPESGGFPNVTNKRCPVCKRTNMVVIKESIFTPHRNRQGGICSGSWTYSRRE